MGQPYVGEIRMFAGNFAPAGWMFCDGAILAISENDTLFNLIGTTYGGDGQETFALPDLRGRVPIHMGTGSGLSTRILAENGGVENVTLTVQQMPAHTHLPRTSTTGDSPSPVNAFWARTSNGDTVYSDTTTPEETMNTHIVSSVGGSAPHDNMQPYLGINFIISLFGVYPSPT